MKKFNRILSAILAGALCCAGAVFPTASAEETILFGDYTMDGIVDADDALAVEWYCAHNMLGRSDEFFAENQIWLPEEQFLAMDISGDGTVDVADAAYLLMFYAESLLLADEMTTEELWEKTLNCDMSTVIEKIQEILDDTVVKMS